MGRHNLEYPKDARSTLNRLGKKRGTYDLEKINTIVHTTPVAHVAFQPGPDDVFPAILPMIVFMGSFESPSAGLDEPLDCYVHGYVSSRIMNLARKTGESKGMPVCITATKMDGLVLSLTPNSHSYNYRSAVLFGHAEVVTDLQEKLWAMEKTTEKVLHGRWDQTRVPPNSAEMQSTQMLRVKIETGSGKIRDVGPGDEAADLNDSNVAGATWTGIVPMVEQFLPPVASTYNQVEVVPEHILDHIERTNATNRAYAETIISNASSTAQISKTKAVDNAVEPEA